MRKFISWISDLFEDERGHVSVKPVIAILGAVSLCVTMFINSVSHHDFEPSGILVDAVVIITTIGMGADTLDKFSFKGKNLAGKSPEDPKQPTPDV